MVKQRWWGLALWLMAMQVSAEDAVPYDPTLIQHITEQALTQQANPTPSASLLAPSPQIDEPEALAPQQTVFHLDPKLDTASSAEPEVAPVEVTVKDNTPVPAALSVPPTSAQTLMTEVTPSLTDATAANIPVPANVAATTALPSPQTVAIPTVTTSTAPAPDITPPPVSFTTDEVEQIKNLSITQRQPPQDPSNRVATNPAAAVLGKNLFFDLRLSGDRQTSCATCHNPRQGWSNTDPLMTLHGVTLARHAPSLWNVGYQRWFFWDGRTDSLWAQALGSLENEAEMVSDRVHLVRLFLQDRTLLAQYEKIFGPMPAELRLDTLPLRAKPRPERDPLLEPDAGVYAAWDKIPATTKYYINQVTANILKTIAAFEMTIQSKPAPFDVFAEQLKADNGQITANNKFISVEAQNGLKLFLGRGKCINCHLGFTFSDAEFHRIFFDPKDKSQDIGRYQGIRDVIANPFNTAGRYADRAEGYQDRIKSVGGINFSEFKASFKTPGLRNIASSAPYMHDGRFQTLNQVITHYNEVQPRGHHVENILMPLGLSEQEQQYLVEFLQTLSSPLP